MAQTFLSTAGSAHGNVMRHEAYFKGRRRQNIVYIALRQLSSRSCLSHGSLKPAACEQDLHDLAACLFHQTCRGVHVELVRVLAV